MRGALPFLSFVNANINGLYSDFPLHFYRFTLVIRSFHVGETIVPLPWNDKNIVSNGFSSTILWI